MSANQSSGSTSGSQDIPAGLLEALQGRNKKAKPALRSFDTFANGLLDLTVGDDANARVNKFQLLCPREECASIILREGVGSLYEGPSVQIEPGNIPKHSLLPAMASVSENVPWWLIQPTPMEFENIGFSRAVDALPLSSDGKKLKLLICADCDLGPLGWCEEGGSKYYLACSRVGYRSTA